MRLSTDRVIAVAVFMIVSWAATAARPAAAASQEIIVPAGTRLPIVLETAVGSDISRIEEPVRGHLARPVVVNGLTAVPVGSEVTGVVTGAKRSGRVKGRARIGVRFDSLVMRGDHERYAMHTAGISRVAPATKTKDALEIGAPAAGGAIVGGLLGGKKGALIGTAVGGGAGTAVVLSTRGREIRLRQGAPLVLRLTEPLRVRVASIKG